MDSKPPGAMPFPPSAAFTTLWILGGATEASNCQGSTVNPETVRFTIAFRLYSGATVRVKALVRVPSKGASIMDVARLIETLELLRSTRWMLPATEERVEALSPVPVPVPPLATGTVVRYPPWSTKAKPEEAFD